MYGLQKYINKNVSTPSQSSSGPIKVQIQVNYVYSAFWDPESSHSEVYFL